MAVGLLFVLCLGREKGQVEGKNGQLEGTKGHGACFFFLVRDSSLQRRGVHSLECYLAILYCCMEAYGTVRLFLNKADKQKTIYAKLQLAFEMLIAVCFNYVFFAVNIQNNLLIPNNLSNRQKSSTNRLNGCLRFMP